MKISKNIIFGFLTEFIVFCALFWLIDSHIVNKRCENINTDSDNGPRIFDGYSEEEHQVYSIVMDECVYDIKLRYQGIDDEEFYVVEPCMYVAKDVVRAIFNPGTLSHEYTIHDVYQESKNRVIKAALKEGIIIPKDNK